MKSILFFIALILISSIKIFSQENFPIAVGNRWEFQANDWDGTGHGSRDTISLFIIGDSIMSNGFKYFTTNHVTRVNNFIRMDSLGIYYYDTLNNKEWLFFRFDIAVSNEYPIGEYIIAGYMMNDIDSSRFIKIYKWNDGISFLFGDSIRIITYFVDTGQDDSYFISISPKYGFLGTHESNQFSNYDLSLIGCNLSGKTYGILTSVSYNIIVSENFSLSQNYPNPFNPTTKIRFTIQTPTSSSPLIKGRNEVGFVSIKVYDILGNEVATLVNEEKPPGSYEVEFPSRGEVTSPLPSGIYFYVLKAGENRLSRKMCLIK
jgi:hypothetical protein